MPCPDHPDPATCSACAAPAGDDRTLEALLAEHRDPCTLHQLAGALEWTLDRVLAAADRLQARLANTGQTLERHGHHTLALRARANVIPAGAKGRCHRQASGPIDLASARVLYRVLTATMRAHLGRPRRARGGQRRAAPDRRRPDRGIRIRAPTNRSLRRDLGLQPPLGAAYLSALYGR